MRKTILTVLASAALSAFNAYGQPRESLRREKATEMADSLPSDIMPLSEEAVSPLMPDRVIPPSPQAASIARYAEYPVSHTTGIPDITVPLYEIDLGGYRLPISISYHASGSKPDQLPTCVGLGWTLNAGGAVSRTVIGKPDMYRASASDSDYRYFNIENLRQLIKDVSDGVSGERQGHLASIITDSPEWDTESDRYTFSVAGRTGVFRYSHEDRKYMVLNNSNDAVRSYGRSGEGISFRILATDGVTYEFAKEENTGVTDYYNEKPFTSTWYVTLIETPYGEITFSYQDATAVDVHCMNVTASSGCVRVLKEHVGPNLSTDYTLEDDYRITHSQSPYTVSYGQKVLRKIEWNGNRVEFDYEDEHPGKTLQRLTGMKVYSSDNTLRKTVTFDNTDNWPTGDSRTGRRLLKSVTDSEAGTWRFEYNKKTKLPPLTDIMGSPACQSDLWGYLNSVNRSTEGDAFTSGQLEWLKAGINDYGIHDEHWIVSMDVGSRDRSPNLACTAAGVLEKVMFPTGGSLTYEYELNSFAGKACGGLRVKSITVSESQSSTVRKTIYGYSAVSLATEDPEKLMNHYFDYIINRSAASPTPPEIGTHKYSHRTSTVFPINPVTAASNSVLYNVVTETRNDGSKARYVYDDSELTELFGVPSDGRVHPSLFQQSVWDFGQREPLLKSKTVYSAEGRQVYCEEYEYEKKERKAFSTGVRTACPYFEYEVPRRTMDPQEGVYAESAAHHGFVQYTASTAFSRVCLLKSRTVTDQSGFSATTEYTYDGSYRTMSPRSVSTAGSDGTATRTEYIYPFDREDAVSKDMMELVLPDYPLEKRIFSGNDMLARNVTEYGLYNNLYYPVSVSAWSVPTGSTPRAMPATLPVREQASSYNSKGRPLSIKANGTDETSFTWNAAGNLLLSSTAPGGLVTQYTHRPLFGLATVVRPNGYRNAYGYSQAGMLQSLADNSGVVEEYAYSISGHPTMNTDGNSVSVLRRLTPSGSQSVLSKQYYSQLGQPSTQVEGGRNTSGKYIFSTTAYDALGRPCEKVLPGAGGTTAGFTPYTGVVAFSQTSHGEEYVRSQTTYDALDRPVKSTTPGDAWHSAGKAKATQYIANAANSVRLYRAPMYDITLVEDGYYAAKTLQGVRTVDEDGNEMTVYTDRLGRKVLERRGPESRKGQNDTYFVYNALGQLRYVLSPGYELSGFKEKFAYEYRYDEHGNVVKKFIPGAGYTQYWYDRAGRLAFMQDPNLRERNMHRFFVYDRAGRLAVQGVSASCNRNIAVNFADWSGKAGGFMQTGYTLTDASRLQQVTLERVNYYDDHTFASVLDRDLFKSGTQSAKGLQTGSVVYGSDGKKSVTAVYYDIKGNVTESRERTPFGTLRTTVNTYTYTGQPLKSEVTEGSVTTITENTYDASSGLLTATDVTVNGVKQRVSAIEYDDLGRIASVTRGAATKSGGKVSYKYNIHGQTTEIKGPGFSQNLHYADGPGKKLYNSSVSAMTWTMGSDTRVRGYKYAYNGYGWLTAAEYGENADLGSNPNRYTERFLGFMPNGGIRRLQRHGLKADGVYGKVDNLHISYDGNRITTVLEDADPVTQVGSMDYPGGKKELAFGYNEWGALVSDGSRGITDISYDRFGNPLRISYTDGSYTENVYSADGVKLKATHATSLNGTVTGKTTTEYRGNVIYRDGKVDMVLFPGGYATINGTTVTFHYYTQDYLGNNRAVINGTTGTIEQTTAYYPYGGIIADLGNPTGGQPYRFGGKELITANGLNEYDFGARSYYPTVPGFTRIDPLCEKTPDLSPYLYCGNNPVNQTDPTGMYIVKESQREWESNRKHIEDRRNSLQKSIDNIKSKGAKNGWSEDKIAKKIGDKQERVASLDNTLSTMSTLEGSEQGYSLSTTSSSTGLTSLGKGGIINIEYQKGSMAMFCHEVAHAGQFESGDIAFISTGDGSYLIDVYDEANAFQAQYAFEPRTVNGLNPNVRISSIADISPGYVIGIRVSGGTPYAPGGHNNTGAVMVRIDSPVQQLLLAFPNNIGYIEFVNSHRFVRNLPDIYYKR